MFAFAIWDGRSKTLVLARDRLGIKPLYYSQTSYGLVFASELKAMLAHSSVARAIDPEAVAEYFVHLCVPGHLSIYQDVRKLPPAHVLLYRNGRTTVSRYWDVTPQPNNACPEEQWIDHLQERLRRTVKLHMIADVPVGAFLSGGLDSGAVVALMASQSSVPIRTFTVGFSGSVGRFDEREAARAVARRYRTDHQECLLEPDVTDIFPRIVRAFDEPFADSSAIPNWLICKETAQHVKVALSGLGGDELFGGYERYSGVLLGEYYRRMPRPLRALLTNLVRALPTGNGSSYFSDRLKRFITTGALPVTEQYRRIISAFADPHEVLHPDVRAATSGRISRFDTVIERLQDLNPLDLAQHTDLSLYLPDDILTLTDRVSMAHSLEVRVPYVDHDLVEFVATMPPRLRVRGLRKKYLFRRAVAPWIPRENLTKPKQGFSIPLASWLKGSLRSMLTDLLDSQDLQCSPWLDRARVAKLVDEHLRGVQNHEVRLWAILCFQEWARMSATLSPAPTPR
jgi:asparagine synthase (glutamine-hydrolysing)